MTSPASEDMGRVRKHYPGCYRITLSADRFGQIKKQGRQWCADVRDTLTGGRLHFAGIWNSRREAIEELRSLSSGAHS